jgi:hypothetical protein
MQIVHEYERLQATRLGRPMAKAPPPAKAKAPWGKP